MEKFSKVIIKFSFKSKLCFLISTTFLIALTSTYYLTEIMTFKWIYLIWVCLFYFFTCANFIIHPVVSARCFGQKNFVAIQSVSSVLTVLHYFIVVLQNNFSFYDRFFFPFTIRQFQF